MNVRELHTILSRAADEDIDIRLYFTEKKSNGYFSYSPVIHNDLQNALKILVVEALSKVQDMEQREFSPIGVLDGTIETASIGEINSYQEIIDSFDEGIVHRGRINGDIIQKLKFCCLKINIVGYGELLTFRRLSKFNRLAKGKSIIGRLTSDTFEKLDPNLLGIDENLDLLVFDDEVLILNHIALERIFSIDDQYTEKATEALEIVREANKIENFDQFREDCLTDKRVKRALTKILNESDALEDCFRNFENVIQVVYTFELDIEFTEGNTALIYEDKSQLMDITRLIRDSFYRTLINNREGIDEGV
ncbi:Kiwa anti-phage protein KwaB-like domain-containing protein [Bacillus subtilis]|uniref:Kiwa anti-phage protein KwaB-like domain-containing protein n=1 Tax=Bacillus subtilis group TaxID=653685 RepID=UPI0021178992|nr:MULTISPECIES: Kiwa anti-phage protein KwaB-like domain-containing protein [Bacillus subtilis group]MDF4200435.1 DUF4868 domain-containing protein [Bacillus subtilis]MDF4218706.1 DUF4868 domain-containing protein [Bacillus subtilis]MEC2401586.1 DUF4868 domain-containing protein [Bacillus subtilis]MED4660252.1 DUF4868 domain-containing protein [Bacillus subtilis]MED4664557.1 DUF4868 domain-containing protein [Bacillus subtilis]